MGAALAAYGDDPWCRDLFDLGLNYMIGVTYPYGFDAAANQGLCYAKVHLFFGTGDGVMQHFVADTVFPEVHFYKNPFWKGVGEWFSRMAPVGFVEADNTWGDACWGLYSVFRRQVGPNLSYYTGSRNLYDHWLAEPASKKDENTVGIENVVLPYYFPPPSGPLEPWPLSRLFASDGWVFGASVPSYANNAFNNGVGFSIIARPRGSEGGHSHFNDLNFQLWAYGTTLTDGGSGMSTYAKHAMSHNCLLVNGIGMVQSQLAPLEPWYARVIAYQTGENYTYCATDGTWAYPHKPFVLGGWLTPSGFASNGYAAGALNAVTKVQRHLLFMRGKYFVFYDEMASTNAATFSWLYQVCENTVSQVDSNTASFTYTSNTRRLTGYDTKAPSVTVLVKHIASNVTLTDMSGINVRSNPITGENYYDDGNMQHIRAHVMWVSNRTPATNFHFLSVVYPIKPGTASPEIKRLDDYTVEVTNGDEHDVISFDSQTKQPVTLLVDLAGLTSGSQPPEAARQGSASDQ
jgi:hypothetical protein